MSISQYRNALGNTSERPAMTTLIEYWWALFAAAALGFCIACIL